MSESKEAYTVLKWWLEGDTDGADQIVEALVQPKPTPRLVAADAIVTLNGTVIAKSEMRFSEHEARECALSMARAAIGALEQVHGKRGTKEGAHYGR